METKYKSLYLYDSIEDKYAQWARVHLVDLIQNCLGKFIVDKDGKGDTQNLYALSKVTKIPEKTLKKWFCVDCELMPGFPVGRNLSKLQNYINSTGKVRCDFNSTSELKKLAQREVENLRIATQDKGLDANSLDLHDERLVMSPTCTSSSYDIRVEINELQASEVDQTEIVRVAKSTWNTEEIMSKAPQGWRDWLEQLLLMILLFVCLEQLPNPFAEGLKSWLWSNVGSDRFRIVILPLGSGQTCSSRKPNTELLIKKRLDNVIREGHLNATVELILDREPVVSEEEAKGIGDDEDAQIVIYGMADPYCPSDSMRLGVYATVSFPMHEMYQTPYTERNRLFSIGHPSDILSDSSLNDVLFVIYWTLGCYEYARDNYPNAISRFRSADSVSTRYGAASQMLGRSYWMLDDDLSSWIEFRRHLKFDSTSAEDYAKLSYLEAQLSNSYDTDSGMWYRRKALEIDPTNLRASLDSLDSFCPWGHCFSSEAVLGYLSYLEIVLSIHSNNSGLHYQQALAYNSLSGDKECYLQSLRKAFRLDKDRYRAEYANALLEAGHMDAARKQIDILLEHEPNEESLRLYGTYLCKQGFDWASKMILGSLPVTKVEA